MKKWIEILKNWNGSMKNTTCIIVSIFCFVYLVIIPLIALTLNGILAIMIPDLRASWTYMLMAVVVSVLIYCIILASAIIYDNSHKENV